MVNAPPRVSTRTGESSSPRADAGDHRGAGAGAARQRLAGAALPDAQRDRGGGRAPACSPRSPGSGSAGGPRSAAPASCTGRARDVGTTCTACGLPIERMVTSILPRLRRSAARVTGDDGGPMSTLTSPSASRRGRIRPPSVSTRISRFAVRPAAVHELHEAARAVAALLHLAAVGVEDAVAEIRLRGRWAARRPGPGRSRRRDAGRRGASTGRNSVRKAAACSRGPQNRCPRPASW